MRGMFVDSGIQGLSSPDNEVNVSFKVRPVSYCLWTVSYQFSPDNITIVSLLVVTPRAKLFHLNE